ncbi:CLUMA_CG010549, isoform A [Clunio marinus]|uniref:CLUMA_CG010549, isoform A n=1 Tax=Clunio marinus TaxID=568069 RepID=A0A1J1IA69_9DIPT|nr:CLUMA_CG010549, isoform A [Clunio marinus]
MTVWDTIELGSRIIEIISYTPEYHDQVLDVVKKAFFRYETVSIGSGVNESSEAQTEIAVLCSKVLEKSLVSIIARDKQLNKIVGVSINLLQQKSPNSERPTFFETFRDNCKNESSINLMNFMIETDNKIDIFEHFGVDSFIDIMYLGVLQDYGKLGIGFSLVKYSVESAKQLKQGNYVDKYLKCDQIPPQLIFAIWSARGSQAIVKFLKMSIWNTIKAKNSEIEIISYSPEYHEQVMEVIRKSFFRFETVSRSCQVDESVEGQKELELLCTEVLEKSSVSIIARDKNLNKIVGVAINVLQQKLLNSEGPTFFETFRDKCRNESSINLMNFMIAADSKVDVFEHFGVDSLVEIMFLAVLEDYGKLGIGFNLVKYSVELAKQLKQGKDVDKYLKSDQSQPKVVAALWSARQSQSIGAKLGFEVINEEPFSNYSFKGKSFAERVNDFTLMNQLAAIKI